MENSIANKCVEFKEWQDKENNIHKLMNDGEITPEEYVEQSKKIQEEFNKKIGLILIR